jgi:hypothetical protein
MACGGESAGMRDGYLRGVPSRPRDSAPMGRPRRVRRRGWFGLGRGSPRGHPAELGEAPPRRPAGAIGPDNRAADPPRTSRGLAQGAESRARLRAYSAPPREQIRDLIRVTAISRWKKSRQRSAWARLSLGTLALDPAATAMNRGSDGNALPCVSVQTLSHAPGKHRTRRWADSVGGRPPEAYGRSSSRGNGGAEQALKGPDDVGGTRR